MTVRFTAVFEQVPEGYIGFVEELPGANTQGATLEEARAIPTSVRPIIFMAAVGPGLLWSGTYLY